jgi:hypothetical protein
MDKRSHLFLMLFMVFWGLYRLSASCALSFLNIYSKYQFKNAFNRVKEHQLWKKKDSSALDAEMQIRAI